MSVEKLKLEENTGETQSTEGEKFDPVMSKKLAEAKERERKERMTGAKVLTAAGFASRHQKIVTSSYEKARKVGQKLVGNNGDRRNDAYVTRIESIIDKHGAKAEKRLWDLSANPEKLTVKIEDVPESYWQTQAQIRRDNGLDEYISDGEKEIIVEDTKKRQYESIKNWSDYLGQEDCPYPMWFKLFTWDGVTKMSAVYDKEAQRFAKRDETTMAPYPHLNPAVLGEIFGTICKVNGLDESGEMEKSSLDEVAEKVTKTYNFNKLYSLFLSRQKVAPEVPKNAEDVHGSWIEYGIGDEKKMAEAAAGTPWCIASPAVGKSYLTKGEYGTDEVDEKNSKAKFLLFHLQDKDTGKLASSACASIRLDTKGQVAEVSGIQTGQVLDDSLVPIVEKKVRTLPGGEKYLEAFADKRELIKIDKKMQSGEELTNEELSFIYELKRPIRKLEMYGDDPRVEAVKQKYPPNILAERKITGVRGLEKLMKKEPVSDITSFMDAGVKLEKIIKTDNYELQDVDELLSRGVSHGDIIRIVGSSWAFENMDYLASRGFEAIEILRRMPASRLLEQLDFLDEHEISYDLRGLIRSAMKQNGEEKILDNREAILSRGGRINYKKIARGMDPFEILRYAKAFSESGNKGIVEKTIRYIKKKDTPQHFYYKISEYLGELIDGGIELENIGEIANSPNRDLHSIIQDLDKLLGANVDVKFGDDDFDWIVSTIIEEPKDLEIIAKHPEKFDLKKISEKLPRRTKLIEIETLIKNNIEVDIEDIVKHETTAGKILFKENIEKCGGTIDIDSEISQLNGTNAFILLSQNYDNPTINKNAKRIAERIIEDGEELTKDIKNAAKPILWRLGLIQ
ncbi:hypothetical protein IJH24_03905 [Candidatus Saccharibacteria bacterium]|nr:hypothetical protein [Candidatus Saccharibacteria bacterium]